MYEPKRTDETKELLLSFDAQAWQCLHDLFTLRSELCKGTNDVTLTSVLWGLIVTFRQHQRNPDGMRRLPKHTHDEHDERGEHRMIMFPQDYQTCEDTRRACRVKTFEDCFKTLIMWQHAAQQREYPRTIVWLGKSE